MATNMRVVLLSDALFNLIFETGGMGGDDGDHLRTIVADSSRVVNSCCNGIVLGNLILNAEKFFGVHNTFHSLFENTDVAIWF
jgi:hypothetical protein